MILSLVSEILSRVARNPEIDKALDTLRRSKCEVHLAGLTDPAKAFVSAVATAQLGRPTVLVVESNQRAEMLLEPVRWFYRAVTRKPGRRVAHLPAYDVLPYESRSPHAEISEDRAVALWRFALSEADLLIVPIQAAVWRVDHSARPIHRARSASELSFQRRLR
jgi:transcription-repair coupling factor (superfamily II helicase)